MSFVGRPANQGGGQGGGWSGAPSTNLWVGNLAPNVSDSDLTQVFAKHGEITDLKVYSGRSFAFVYYKRVECAKAAKAALQGYVIKGSPLMIEFAKPAKPSKRLWVGGVSSSVTKEQLEDEFTRFGTILESKFIRDRNAAIIEYGRIEDASAALKSLNGQRIGGENLRVDFLRSQPVRREQFDFNDQRDLQFRGMGGPEPSWTSQNSMKFHPEAIYSGPGREQPSYLIGGEAGHPSRVLWVGYPSSVVIDEHMLHNAMILYGEIERVKSFPSMHYSLVEFRSVEEARNAKESLEGKLFNDPRIHIMYYDLASNDIIEPYPLLQGQRPENFMDNVLRYPPPRDVLGRSQLTPPNNFSGGPPLTGAFRLGGQGPCGPRDSFDTPPTAPVFHDASMIHASHDLGNPMYSTRGHFSAPTAGFLPPAIHGWPQNNLPDSNQILRESKRARTDFGASFSDPPLNLKGDDLAVCLGKPYFASSQHDVGDLSRSRAGNRSSPVDLRVPKGPLEVQSARDYIWRGAITKGHIPVCRARCIPVGEGIDFRLPDVVDCSARAGLDMLAEQYAKAVGFDIVFFLPDGEEDFASYTEFLHYLGSKNRAGVAKLNGGITMFLVPPSDFLTEVLKVVGPERLYGVVLKLAEKPSFGLPSMEQVNQPISSMHSMGRLPAPHPGGYNMSSQREQSHMGQLPVPHPGDYNMSSQREQSHMDHHKASYNGPILHSEAAIETPVMQMAPQYSANGGAAPASGTGALLSHDLIFTLASMLPANAQPSAGQQNPVPSQMGQTSAQFGYQMNSQVNPATEFRTHPASGGASIHPPQFQNPPHGLPYSLPQQAVVSSMPPGNLADAPQSYHYVGSSQVSQPFQEQVSYNTQNGYGVGTGVPVTTAQVGLPDGQPPRTSPLPDNLVASATENLPGSLNQVTYNQPLSDVPDKATGEVEDDRNQRYQSTLQFAANLLKQIQQRQQAGSQAMPGIGNQQ